MGSVGLTPLRSTRQMSFCGGCVKVARVDSGESHRRSCTAIIIADTSAPTDPYVRVLRSPITNHIITTESLAFLDKVNQPNPLCSTMMIAMDFAPVVTSDDLAGFILSSVAFED